MPAKLDYDQIAAWIHGHFMKANPGAVYTEFEKLPEFLKADNRDAAIRIGKVLAMAGLRLEHRKKTKWPAAQQDRVRRMIEANLDLLAEAEHDGWMESRFRNAWRLGPQKNIDKRESHLLVPYSGFAEQIELKQETVGPALKANGAPMSVDEEVEAEKDKDRASVRSYVEIIARTDYRIVREE